MIFITAFLTGLLGSFHCAGMCGPIALATPVVGNTTYSKVQSKLVYNGGRLVTYSLLGALFGAFGWGLKLAGIQQWISIGAGVLIIASVVFSSGLLQKNIGIPFRFLQGNRIGKLFREQKYSSLFTIGLLNGILPCGFVYVGLIASVATQGIAEGALFMFLFGMGTLPMMFAVSMMGQFLTQSARFRINRLMPLITIIIGFVFILRGLNLGIPYLSPQLSHQQTEIENCCKPVQTK
jgi:sulfite exporter TauE/SafE